jgi:hypothetical protein
MEISSGLRRYVEYRRGDKSTLTKSQLFELLDCCQWLRVEIGWMILAKHPSDYELVDLLRKVPELSEVIGKMILARDRFLGDVLFEIPSLREEAAKKILEKADVSLCLIQAVMLLAPSFSERAWLKLKEIYSFNKELYFVVEFIEGHCIDAWSEMMKNQDQVTSSDLRFVAKYACLSMVRRGAQEYLCRTTESVDDLSYLIQLDEVRDPLLRTWIENKLNKIRSLIASRTQEQLLVVDPE